MKALLLAIALVLIGFPAYAQTPVVPINAPFSVVADYTNGPGVATGFRCYVDNIKIGSDLPASALVNGKVTCQMPGQTAGTHGVQIAAFNAINEARSPSLSFLVGSAPNAPTNLQITLQIAVQSNGTATLQAFTVVKQP